MDIKPGGTAEVLASVPVKIGAEAFFSSMSVAFEFAYRRDNFEKVRK